MTTHENVESPEVGQNTAENAVENSSSAEYHAPASQEELNRIIESRLMRERAKYSDYEELKSKAGRVEALTAENEELKQSAAAIIKEKEALEKAAEIESIRKTVSNETGIPSNLLTAETEDEMRAQAANISAYVGAAGRSANSPFIGSDGRKGQANITNAQRFGSLVKNYLEN